MLGGVFFPLAPLFIVILLLLLSFVLYREFRHVPSGIVLPWYWVFLGFFWSVSHLTLPYAQSIPFGDAVFRGCLRQVEGQGQKTFSGVFLTTFADGRREELRLVIPVSRLEKTPKEGDCFSGDVFLSDHPDMWTSQHVFLSFLDNGYLQGQIRPWNVFVPDHTTGHSNGWKSFLIWSPERVPFLETVLEAHFPAAVSGLIEAMVLSDTSHVSPRMNEIFLGSGVYHLLSVSGEHMGLLAAFLSGAILVAIRFLPLPVLRRILARIFIHRLLAILVIPVLIAYTTLIGMPLPAGRALLAASFVLASRGWGASLHREDLFGISVIVMMILIPDLPRSISMDLSLMAVLGVLAALRKEASERRRDVSAFITAETLETGLWVTLFTTPLLWGVFNIGDLVGILSNPVIVPLAGEVLLPAGFAYLGLVFFFGWTSSLLEAFLNVCSRAVISLATFFSGIRLGQISLPSVPTVFLLAFNGWLLGLFLRKKHSRGLFADIVPLLLMIAPILFLSAADHVLRNKSGQRFLTNPPGVMPALVRRSEIVPVVATKETFGLGGLLWSPEREYRNLVRLAQTPAGYAGGR